MLIRSERMSDTFMKYHIDGLPFPMVLHHFTAPDHGDPHDHPWAFVSTILRGGYTEEIFDLDTGKSRTESRLPGQSFMIEAEHVHRIVRLHLDECWTAVLPLPGPTRTSGFYRFQQKAVLYRFWHQQEWVHMRSYP